MTRCLPIIATISLAALALTSCDETGPTQPTIVDQPANTPDFALAANSWTTKASIPTPRYSHALGVANNSLGQPVIYAFGGTEDSPTWNFPTSSVQAYNAATNTWADMARMPVGLFEANGVGLIGGKLYIPGGKSNGGDGTEYAPYLLVYDPRSNTWSQKADLPRLVARGITGVIDGKLYVLTGECSDCARRITHRLYRYDPATNVWDTSLPWCPQAHMDGAGGVINGKFYVAGGVGRDGALTKQLHIYDPATNKWTAGASMPTARASGDGAVLNGKLFVLGGYDRIRTVEAYDPVRNVWASKAPMPTGRHYLAVARYTLNGTSRILAVGGVGSPAVNESYTP